MTIRSTDPAFSIGSTATLSIGDVIADRYRIDAVLGEGGMGVVYRVEHLHLRKPHALKVLLPEWSSMPEVVARFEREAVAAGNIRSPHVASATDFGRLPTGAFFLVMEYVRGRTLRSVVEEGPLAPARALHVVHGIASALHAAHAAGIVHRDLKPENVVLTDRDGDPDFVKVLDFGIAKVDEAAGAAPGKASTALTKAGSVLGTPDYMSPEQALGQPVDARSDFYSLGVILFELLTGRCPFEGSAVTVLRQRVLGEAPVLPASLADDVDAGVGALLGRLLARLPEARFASAGELIAALDECSNRPAQLVAARPSLEPVQGVVTPVGRRISVARGRRRRLVAAAVLLAILSLTILVLVLRSPPETQATPAASGTGGVLPVASATIPAPEPSPPTVDEPSAGDPAPWLPPPPVPSASFARPPPARPSPSQEQSHRTGPGGIYIPPPSQWFK